MADEHEVILIHCSDSESDSEYETEEEVEGVGIDVGVEDVGSGNVRMNVRVDEVAAGDVGVVDPVGGDVMDVEASIVMVAIS